MHCGGLRPGERVAAMQREAAAVAAAGPAAAAVEAPSAQPSADGVVQADSLAVLLTQVPRGTLPSASA